MQTLYRQSGHHQGYHQEECNYEEISIDDEENYAKTVK